MHPADIDECVTNPCQNGGSCTNEVGHFLCTCTANNGSVVVHYELAVKKETAEKTLNTIVETVKKVAKEDSFGKFTVDADSVSAKKTDLYSYYGRLTIGNRLYNEELADVTSEQYKNLSAEIISQGRGVMLCQKKVT
ncbi:hypothetical protein NP493_2307g00001 [Ridgeia piscesae]|uniref:EGF-like domain-containing protein n=1 Tax=Ridgeia piscesae TaxID=27915 RepID=A0AAD9JJ41_RIDPI|nr:hypothetical protein NP493_2307g00001 [Ridgeia piscesae]